MPHVTGNSNDVVHFENDDDGFLRWIESNHSGYVVDTYRSPSAGYLKFHRATCPHLKGDSPGSLTLDYTKTCSKSEIALASWAKQKTGGELQPCHYCISK